MEVVFSVKAGQACAAVEKEVKFFKGTRSDGGCERVESGVYLGYSVGMGKGTDAE